MSERATIFSIFFVVRRSLFEAEDGSQSLGFFWGACVGSFTFMPFEDLLLNNSMYSFFYFTPITYIERYQPLD